MTADPEQVLAGEIAMRIKRQVIMQRSCTQADVALILAVAKEIAKVAQAAKKTE